MSGGLAGAPVRLAAATLLVLFPAMPASAQPDTSGKLEAFGITKKFDTQKHGNLDVTVGELKGGVGLKMSEGVPSAYAEANATLVKASYDLTPNAAAGDVKLKLKHETLTGTAGGGFGAGGVSAKAYVCVKCVGLDAETEFSVPFTDRHLKVGAEAKGGVFMGAGAAVSPGGLEACGGTGLGGCVKGKISLVDAPEEAARAIEASNVTRQDVEDFRAVFGQPPAGVLTRDDGPAVLGSFSPLGQGMGCGSSGGFGMSCPTATNPGQAWEANRTASEPTAAPPGSSSMDDYRQQLRAREQTTRSEFERGNYQAPAASPSGTPDQGLEVLQQMLGAMGAAARQQNQSTTGTPPSAAAPAPPPMTSTVTQPSTQQRSTQRTEPVTRFGPAREPTKSEQCAPYYNDNVNCNWHRCMGIKTRSCP